MKGQRLAEVDDCVHQIPVAPCNATLPACMMINARPVLAIIIAKILFATSIADLEVGVAVQFRKIRRRDAGFPVNAIDILRNQIF